MLCHLLVGGVVTPDRDVAGRGQRSGCLRDAGSTVEEEALRAEELEGRSCGVKANSPDLRLTMRLGGDLESTLPT